MSISKRLPPLQLLLASVGFVIGLWILYEQVWLSIEYDLETKKIESQLDTHIKTLRERFRPLPPEKWEATVQEFNATSDRFLALIPDSRPAWDELYGRLNAEGGGDVLLDGVEAFALVALEDGRTLLRLDIIYVTASSFDWAYWTFIAIGAIGGTAMLAFAWGPVARRLRNISIATAGLAKQGSRPIPRMASGNVIREIERNVDALGTALAEAVSGLNESVGNQRDLLHAVAHEFRGPIGRIRFAHDLLSECEDPEKRMKYATRIDQAVDELEELVTEVLGYSRIRHGGYRPDIAPIDLSALVSRSLDKAREEHPRIRFEQEVPKDLEVEADARMLERALINIVRNAGRFAERNVLVEATAKDDEILLAVHDDGPGVAPGKRERIFEPFTRIDASRSRESGGTGLGLAIVAAIALQHGGAVECHDSPLGGALFTLRWPQQG